MITQRPLATTCLGILLSLPAVARAEPRVVLHVGTDYDSCYFDLHPELTAGELREFAAEGGQVIRSRQLSGADPLGKGGVDVSLVYADFFLDDTKGAWNNTMSHPAADHYLGTQLRMPFLQLRVGVSDRVDVEASGTINPESNYGAVGLASKIRVLGQGGRVPVSVSVRPSVAALVGPSEVQAYDTSVDVAVSRRFHGVSPFVGVTTSATLVVESSPDTDVGNQAATRSLAFAGVEYQWRHVRAVAQAEIADLPALALSVGGTF